MSMDLNDVNRLIMCEHDKGVLGTLKKLQVYLLPKCLECGGTAVFEKETHGYAFTCPDCQRQSTLEQSRNDAATSWFQLNKLKLLLNKILRNSKQADIEGLLECNLCPELRELLTAFIANLKAAEGLSVERHELMGKLIDRGEQLV